MRHLDWWAIRREWTHTFIGALFLLTAWVAAGLVVALPALVVIAVLRWA